MTMKLLIAATLLACLFALSCTSSVENSSSNSKPTNRGFVNSNTNPADPPKDPPTPAALYELEKQAFEAWKKKDAKFFEVFLADNFVSVDERGKRIGKAEMIKMVGNSNCNFKTHSFSNQNMIPVGEDAAVLMMQVEADYTCGGKKGPSKVSSASVYVRSGRMWKGAYHAEVPLSDPDPLKPQPSKKVEPPKPTASELPSNDGDQLTDSLMALELKGWEAWKERDQKQLEDMTANDLALIDPFGGIHSTKNDVIKVWIGQNCDIKNVGVTDGKATQITSDAAVLTYRGEADAICNGRPVQPIWGTTIFVKSGDTWEPVFVLESPA